MRQTRLFFGCLLGPPLLCLLSCFGMRQFVGWAGTDFSFSIPIAILGTIGGGAVCGAQLAQAMGNTRDAQIVLGIFLIPIMMVVIFTLCCCGCGLGINGF